MKLKDLLPNKKTIIEYRTFHPAYGDLYQGTCAWDGNNLIAYDNDNYSIEDEITDYKITRQKDSLPDILTVWYKSGWITG
jgi:hypothetical protein